MNDDEPALPLQSPTTIPPLPVVVPASVVVVWKPVLIEFVRARYRIPLGRLTTLFNADAPTVNRLTVALKLSRADISSVAWLPPTLPLPTQTCKFAAVFETFKLPLAPPEIVTNSCCAPLPESNAPMVKLLVLKLSPLLIKVL